MKERERWSIKLSWFFHKDFQGKSLCNVCICHCLLSILFKNMYALFHLASLKLTCWRWPMMPLELLFKQPLEIWSITRRKTPNVQPSPLNGNTDSTPLPFFDDDKSMHLKTWFFFALSHDTNTDYLTTSANYLSLTLSDDFQLNITKILSTLNTKS